MAVRITFDDHTDKVFDEAVTIHKEYDRAAPFELVDGDSKVVALVPDFGVRVVAIE